MKLKVQAQHLHAGDIVGSGETIAEIVISSIHWPSNKVYVKLDRDGKQRSTYWGKHTMINVERNEVER